MRAKERMELHALEQLVHIERCVMIVEPNHEPDRYLFRAERIHEASAEGVGRKRPAEGMDHSIQRALDLPDFLYAEGKDLGIGGPDLLPGAPALAQRSACSLRQDRDFPRDIRWLLVARTRRARTVETSRGSANSANRITVNQQRFDRKAGKDVYPQLLSPLAQPAYNLAE